MSPQSDKPMDSAPAEESAAWVALAEGLRASLVPARAAELDYTWRSLRDIDRLIGEETESGSPLPIRRRMALVAYLGETLVRQFGGAWATGEHYGEVIAPESARSNKKASSQPARPSDMIEKRLTEGISLQHQVFEQARAWRVEKSETITVAGADGPAAMMRLAAEAFVKSAGASGISWLDYSAESVRRLDALIAEWWPEQAPKDAYEAMAPAMGAYVGEVLTMDTGGHWVRDDTRGFGVELRGQVVFPVTEVSRRFQLGSDNSISSFYDEISARWHREGERERSAAGKRGLFGRGRN